MTIHLDTNMLVEVGLSGSAMRASLIAWLKEENYFAASTIAWSEFCNGPLEGKQMRVTEAALDDRILAFTKPMAETASALFNQSGRRRGSHADCMIAATAIISDAPLSTLNTKDFERFIPFGLRLHSF
jgi:predicted nucleic acid-binding protein